MGRLVCNGGHLSNPADIRIHYQAVFDLRSNDSDLDCAAAVVRLVRSWVKSKEFSKGHVVDSLGKGWLFTFGDWQCKGSTVEVRSEAGRLDAESPEFWAIRYDEVCNEERNRRWRTDIALTRLDEAVRVAVRVSHYLTPAFIGVEPEPPTATSPKIVKTVLKDRRWHAFAGIQELKTTPTDIKLGHVPSFIGGLTDSGRTVPIIVVSASRETGEPAVSATELAWHAAGAASVFTLPSSEDVIQEANYYLPREYRCFNGLVRVFMPGVDLRSGTDWRRHRFFTPDYVAELGGEAILGMIYRGLARRPLVSYRHCVLDVDDVAMRRMEHERGELRRQLEGAANSNDLAAQKEWSEFLLDDNGRLSNHLVELSQQLDDLNGRLGDRDTELLTEMQAHEDDIKEYEYRIRSAEDRLSRQDAEIAGAKAAEQAWEELDAFPSDLTSVLRLVQRLYPSRVVVLDEALDSAQGWPFDADKAWRVLRAMAIHLPRLHFDSQGVDIEKEFEGATGFSLAMAERKLTKENKRAVQQRQRDYRGGTIDITPHVKVGSAKPNMLRVHYYPDHEAKVIVIGHCGDHLETAGTRKVR